MRLVDVDMAGEAMARYYKVDTRQWLIINNTNRASFCQTVIRSRRLDAIYTACQKKTSSFIDGRLWEKDIKKKLFADKAYCVGIKGMPGRKGIGIGHRNNVKYQPDTNLVKLKEWIGNEEDTDFYSQFFIKK